MQTNTTRRRSPAPMDATRPVRGRRLKDDKPRGRRRRRREDDDAEAKPTFAKVHVNICLDEKFLSLDDFTRTVFMHLLVCPENQRLPGLLRMSATVLADQLRRSKRKVDNALELLVEKDMVRTDGRVIWLPNALRYREPDSELNVKGWARALKDGAFAECELGREAIRAIYAHLIASKRAHVAEPIARTFPKIIVLPECGFTTAFTTPSGTAPSPLDRDSDSEAEQAAAAERAPRAAAAADVTVTLGCSPPVDIVEETLEVVGPAPIAPPAEPRPVDVPDVPEPPRAPPALSVVASDSCRDLATEEELDELEEVLLTAWEEHRGSLPPCLGLTHEEAAWLRDRITEDPRLRQPARLVELARLAGSSAFLARPDRMPPATLGWLLRRPDRLEKLFARAWHGRPPTATATRAEPRSPVPTPEATRRDRVGFVRKYDSAEQERRADEARRAIMAQVKVTDRGVACCA